MNINENSLLALMNPFSLLFGGIVVCVLGYFCAKRYRNTNDFAKSVRMYIPCVLILNVVLVLVLDLAVILVIGLDICGFISMAIVSNYYFYH